MKITKSKPFILLFLIFSCLLTVGAFSQIRTSNPRPSSTPGFELYSQPSSLSMKEVNSTQIPNQRLNRKKAEDYLLKQVSAKRKEGNGNQSLKALQPLSDPLPGCADTSQRRLYWLQGRPAYLYYSIRARDGGIFAVGATLDIEPPTDRWDVFPFIIKFSEKGKVLWNRQLRGNVRGEMDLQYLYEMADGSLLAAGDMQTIQRFNPADPREYDALIVKISPNGELIWSKTFMSTSSECYNSTGLYLTGFVELPGEEIAVSGTVYNCPIPMIPVVMRLSAKGDLIWSRAFDDGGSLIYPHNQGLFYSGNQISVIMVELESIWKIDMPLSSSGDINYTRVGYDFPDYNNKLNALFGNFNTQIIQLDNGNYRLISATQASISTRFRDTSSIFGILDLTPKFEPVQYRVLLSKTRADYNQNSFFNLQPNGRIDVVQFEYLSDYSANFFVSQFAPNGNAIKHRKLIYNGVGIPANSFLLPEFNGEQNLVQTYYDSYEEQFFIENTRLHFSDTDSDCLGYDTATFFWGVDKYKVLPYQKLRVFDTTILPTVHTVWQDTLIKTDLFDGCSQVNYCDSLSIIPPATLVCRPDQVLSLDAYVNKACGAWVQWRPQFPEKMTVTVTGRKKADIRFLGNYDGWLYAEMQGNCAFLHDSVRFTVANLPDPLTIGPDTVICPGNFITLRATAGYTAYQWNTGQSGDSITISKAGKYWVTASDACGAFVTDTLEVKAYVPGLFSAGDDSKICPGETLSLEATPGYFNYKWMPDSFMQNAATPKPTIKPLKTTLYRVQAEERPGCMVSDSVWVVVSEVPPFSLGPDFSICIGESRMLNGPDSFAAYKWSTGVTTRDIEVNQPGTYFLEALSVDGCPRRDTVRMVSLHQLPIVRLDKDSVLCAGETKTYSTGAVYPAYLWSNGTVASTLSTNLPGQYWVQVTDNNGCKGSDTTRIAFIQPLPAAFLPADSSVCSYDSWQIKPLQNFSSYLWSNGATTPAITVNKADIYRLVVTDTYGCKGEDEVKVSVEQCMEGLFVPSAFTPNGDGNNDNFKALLFGNIEIFDLKIYNRFGELIFASANTGAGWNGMFRGKSQPAGSYIWQCRFQLQGQPVKEQKGTFLLIR